MELVNVSFFINLTDFCQIYQVFEKYVTVFLNDCLLCFSGMVEIEPFRGIMYNEDEIKDFGLVITPPYDVINEDEKERFFGLSEYNMVNLLLGGAGGYAEIAKHFDKWQEKKVLVRDDEDSVYIYSQTFDNNGSLFTRVGFISLLKLGELGEGVLPHEKTLEKPFKDRLALLNATKANFGSVFVLYDDRAGVIDSFIRDRIDEGVPDMDFEDSLGIKHSLWKVSDEGFIDGLREGMLQCQCVIADGHHRYRSVLRFREEHSELGDAAYTLCCFVNSFNEGLFILPIDRFVFGLKDLDIDKVLDRLKEYFDIEEVSDVNLLIKKVDGTPVMVDKSVNLKNNVFGMYCYLNKKSYFLRLKDRSVLDGSYPDSTDVYRKLDVNILHRLVFEGVLGISEEDQYKGTHIEYTKGNKRALEKLDDDKYQFAFFMNAPLMREIFLTARAGETMPQKSTYFYPKIYSGLVMNKIDK